METISLYKLQERFTECLFDSELSADSLPLKQAIEEKDRRLNIYRNNVFHSLSTALADLYPVVVQLLGEEYFKACARAYLQRHPPQSAAMVDFGFTFPDFIREFEPLESYPWLAGVARVELAWHEAYHAIDSQVLDPKSLNNIPSDRLANSHFVLHPSVRLLSSPFPVYSIWQAHQGDQDPEDTINLDIGEEFLCIFRPQYEVLVKPLDSDTMDMLERLKAGAGLAEVVESVMTQSPKFNVENALSEALKDGIFQDIKEEIT